MNVTAILLLGLLAAPFAAGSAWLAKRICVDRTPRQRVFNAAAIVPTVIASAAACFATVILLQGGGEKFLGAENFLLQAITTVLVAFATGMVSAYLVEQGTRS